MCRWASARGVRVDKWKRQETFWEACEDQRPGDTLQADRCEIDTVKTEERRSSTGSGSKAVVPQSRAGRV
eukprot:2386270-Pleurochrysis_carterae.AAC.4